MASHSGLWFCRASAGGLGSAGQFQSESHPCAGGQRSAETAADFRRSGCCVLAAQAAAPRGSAAAVDPGACRRPRPPCGFVTAQRSGWRKPSGSGGALQDRLGSSLEAPRACSVPSPGREATEPAWSHGRRKGFTSYSRGGKECVAIFNLPDHLICLFFNSF